jgi:hypothetical protein
MSRIIGYKITALEPFNYWPGRIRFVRLHRKFWRSRIRVMVVVKAFSASKPRKKLNVTSGIIEGILSPPVAKCVDERRNYEYVENRV